MVRNTQYDIFKKPRCVTCHQIATLFGSSCKLLLQCSFFFFHFQIWIFLWELFPLQYSTCVKSIKKMLTAANVNEHINFACLFFSPPSFLLRLNFPCLASLLLRVLFLEAAVYFEARSGESQRLQNQAQDSQCSTVRLALGTSSWPERSS